MRFLEEFGRALSLSNPEFVFRNPQKLDAFFKDAYRQIDKGADSETDADDRKARLFAARERLTHASAMGGNIRSTRQLGRGAPLTFIAPGEESYPSVILAVEPSGLAVEPVSDSYGEALRFRRGTKLTCYFYAKSHQGYQFATRVIGWEKIGGKDAMVLAHSEAVSALPARRHARRETKAPCTFYRVAVTAAKSGAAKGQQKNAAKVENIPYPGTIVDISAGGLGIQTANPLACRRIRKDRLQSGRRRGSGGLRQSHQDEQGQELRRSDARPVRKDLPPGSECDSILRLRVRRLGALRSLTLMPGPTYNYSMKVVELRDLARRDSPLHYIKELTAVAVIEWNERQSESDISITLEHGPLGPPDVRVRLLDAVELPTLSVIHAIRDFVVEMERSGRLP